MAGDWIKMRASLLSSPKVNGIARALESDPRVSAVLTTGFSGAMSEIVTRNVMRHVTVAALLSVWSAANEHTEDGVFCSADLDDIDDIAGLPGFGAAMESVGWAIRYEESDSVQLPNFLEYNAPGKARAKSSAAERQRRYRERQKEKRDATRDVTSNDREEKRRSNTPQPPKGGEYTDEFECFWKAYPNGKGKAAASKAWGRLSPENRSQALENVRHRAAHDPDWTRDGGQFVPMASTYLNGRRWEDEIDRAPQRPRIVV